MQRGFKVITQFCPAEGIFLNHMESHLKKERAQKKPHLFPHSFCSFTMFGDFCPRALPVKGVCAHVNLCGEGTEQE